MFGYNVPSGMDVAKHTHHASALDVEGERLLVQEMEASETAMQEVFESACGHGEVLVLVDQRQSIGLQAVTIAPSMGLDVAYLPGLGISETPFARWREKAPEGMQAASMDEDKSTSQEDVLAKDLEKAERTVGQLALENGLMGKASRRLS